MTPAFRISRYLALVSFTGLIGGCTTFTERDCRQMDWSMQGRLSALRGQTDHQGLLYYDQECGQTHGVFPDQKLFRAGFTEGLKEFCRPGFVHQFASGGGVYLGTCPADSESAILTHYNSGRTVYLERRVNELDLQIRHLSSRVSSLQSELSSCQSSERSCRSSCHH